MNCPYCGAKVRDPELSMYCPACCKQLPVITHEEQNSMLFRRISSLTAGLALILLILGFTLLLPEVIVAWIGGLDGHTLFWPVQFLMILAGVVFLIVRHPFAKRSALANIRTLRAVEEMWVCSYCGKNNAPGSRDCESCGAPLK